MSTVTAKYRLTEQRAPLTAVLDNLSTMSIADAEPVRYAGIAATALGGLWGGTLVVRHIMRKGTSTSCCCV